MICNDKIRESVQEINKESERILLAAWRGLRRNNDMQNVAILKAGDCSINSEKFLTIRGNNS